MFMPSPPTIIWHPFTDKSAFVSSVRFSTICQITWEEVYPSMCQVIGIYRPWSWLWTSSCLSQLWSRSPWKRSLKQSPKDKRAFVDVRVSSRGVSAHCWSKNKTKQKNKPKFGHIGEGQRNGLTLAASLLP